MLEILHRGPESKAASIHDMFAKKVSNKESII